MAYTSDEKLEILAYARSTSDVEARRKYGVSRTTLMKWEKQCGGIPAIKRTTTRKNKSPVKNSSSAKDEPQEITYINEEIVEVSSVELLVDEDWRERANKFYNQAWQVKELTIARMLALVENSKNLQHLSSVLRVVHDLIPTGDLGQVKQGTMYRAALEILNKKQISDGKKNSTDQSDQSE